MSTPRLIWPLHSSAVYGLTATVGQRQRLFPQITGLTASGSLAKWSKPMNAKSYDVIAFGATSFVGKLLCRYFANHFDSGELKWAAAGRSIEKLELMRRSLDRKDADI